MSALREWNPISTIPNDHRAVLLWPHYVVSIASASAKWFATHWAELNPPELKKG